MKKLFCLVLLICGCASGPPEKEKVQPQKTSAKDLRDFKDAEAAYKSHNYPVAVKKLSWFAQKHPNTELASEAFFELGQIYFETGDYFKASRYWGAVVDGDTVTPMFDRALVNDAQAQTQLGHYDEALTLLSRLRVTQTTDPQLASSAFELSGKLKLQKSDPLGAVSDLLTASDFKRNPIEAQNLVNKASEIVEGNLNRDQIETVLSKDQFKRLELPARLRLGMILYDLKSWPAAKKEFLSIVERFPNTESARRAQQYVDSIDAQQRTDSSVVGAILPLTGKDQQTGYKILRGVELGLGLYNRSNPSPLKLAIVDSESNPDVARRGVERLVSEDHVIAIIGDILSNTAQAVAAKAQELGVPTISLSQKSGVNEIGDFIFRSAPTPEMQMNALVDYAMSARGYKKFAILFPNNAYGTLYATAFWDQVLARGGEITGAQPYAPSETDFRYEVDRLIGTFYGDEDRARELKLRLAAWQKEQKDLKKKPTSNRDNTPKDILPPIVDFDALFIPDGPTAVGQIAPMLEHEEVKSLPLLGTLIWDDPELVKRGSKYVENSLFFDSYFNEDQNRETKQFAAMFQNQFSYKPNILESIGYDAAVLVLQALRNASFSTSRVGLRDKLAALSGVQGATGALRISPAREAEKTFVPLTILKGQIVKLETGTMTH